MSIMMSQILKFVDFTKTQTFRYLENKALFFLQIKKFINYTSRATLWQIILLQWMQPLTLSWRRSLSNRNHSTDLLCKSMDRFLFDRDLRHKRVNIKILSDIVWKTSSGLSVLIKFWFFLKISLCFNVTR